MGVYAYTSLTHGHNTFPFLIYPQYQFSLHHRLRKDPKPFLEHSRVGVHLPEAPSLCFSALPGSTLFLPPGPRMFFSLEKWSKWESIQVCKFQ